MVYVRVSFVQTHELMNFVHQMWYKRFVYKKQKGVMVADVIILMDSKAQSEVVDAVAVILSSVTWVPMMLTEPRRIQSRK
jgi:hypothetical protein